MKRQSMLLVVGAAMVGAVLGYMAGGVHQALLLGVGSVVWSLVARQIRSRRP